MHHKSTKNAPERCTFETRDANEQARNLTDWHQKYDQVGAGRFYGRIDELRLNDLQVYREHSSHTLYQQCMVRSDGIWFGIPDNPEDCRINGQPLDQTDILCRPGNQPFDLMTPDRFNMLGIVVSQHELMKASLLQGVEIKATDAVSHPRLRLPPKTLQQLRYLITRIVESRSGRIPLDSRIHHDLLMMALLEVLEVEQPNAAVSPSYSHRKSVVEKIRAYTESASDLPVTISELCEVACVSRRTLQYSFESILGISPTQFLRVNRLNCVKRILSGNGSSSVSDVAAMYGFYHLSQFSADYKQLFGELPSQTLAIHSAVKPRTQMYRATRESFRWSP